MDKIVATLACRVQSERLYAKPLQKIGDKTVLERQISILKKVKEIDEIVLAISEGQENYPFIKFAGDNGFKYVLGSQQDVQQRLIMACELVKGDILFRVTTECPFVYIELIPEIVQKHKKENYDLSVITDLPDGVFFELINYKAIKKAHDIGKTKHKSELCTLFIYENQDMFKVNRIKPPEHFKRPELRLTIDYPEDLILFRQLYYGLNKEWSEIKLEEIIKYLDQHPKLKELVSNCEDKIGRVWEK